MGRSWGARESIISKHEDHVLVYSPIRSCLRCRNKQPRLNLQTTFDNSILPRYAKFVLPRSGVQQTVRNRKATISLETEAREEFRKTKNKVSNFYLAIQDFFLRIIYCFFCKAFTPSRPSWAKQDYLTYDDLTGEPVAATNPDAEILLREDYWTPTLKDLLGVDLRTSEGFDANDRNSWVLKKTEKLWEPEVEKMKVWELKYRDILAKDAKEADMVLRDDFWFSVYEIPFAVVITSIRDPVMIPHCPRVVELSPRDIMCSVSGVAAGLVCPPVNVSVSCEERKLSFKTASAC